MLRNLFMATLLCAPAAFTAQSRVTAFTAINMTDSVRLNITISAGPVCAGFQILKGADSLNLYQVYVYPGLCGNTSYAQAYTYTDISPNKTAPNFYEVLIPPGDYSPMLKVNSAANYSNLLIFPQPAQDVLNITIANLVSYYYEMTIFDRFGRKQGFANGNASGAITLNVSSFQEGVYIFYIVDGSGNAYRGKFIKIPSY